MIYEYDTQWSYDIYDHMNDTHRYMNDTQFYLSFPPNVGILI